MKTKLLIMALLACLHVECQTFDASSIRMYWKDSKGIPYMTFERLLKTNKNIAFITGVGKFSGAFSSIGLFIENGQLLHPIKTVQNTKVNREIQPCGVFISMHLVHSLIHYNQSGPTKMPFGPYSLVRCC